VTAITVSEPNCTASVLNPFSCKIQTNDGKRRKRRVLHESRVHCTDILPASMQVVSRVTREVLRDPPLQYKNQAIHLAKEEFPSIDDRA
jgi:hypothetical protein